MSATYDKVYAVMDETLRTKFQVPADEIKPTTTVGDIDLDSLALAELTVIIGEELGREVNEDGVRETTTLEEFVRILEASAAGSGAPPALDAR